MLNDNQSLSVKPYGDGITLALITHYDNGAVMITRHVQFNEDPLKYLMLIESAVIYLQKKTENHEL